MATFLQEFLFYLTNNLKYSTLKKRHTVSHRMVCGLPYLGRDCLSDECEGCFNHTSQKNFFSRGKYFIIRGTISKWSSIFTVEYSVSGSKKKLLLFSILVSTFTE